VLTFACVTFPMSRVFQTTDLAPSLQAGLFYCRRSNLMTAKQPLSRVLVPFHPLFTESIFILRMVHFGCNLVCSQVVLGPLERLGQARRRAYGPPPGRRS
jgi:hypothetical protein